MNKNVVDHEPYLALFVPDENALIFYEALALFGKKDCTKAVVSMPKFMKSMLNK